MSLVAKYGMTGSVCIKFRPIGYLPLTLKDSFLLFYDFVIPALRG